MNSDEYLRKITSAHITRPKYMAWLKELLDLLCEIGTVFEDMNAAYSVETAIGRQLDVVGTTVGVDRPLSADDEDYRKLIYAKIMRNMWDGTNENLVVLWDTIYPNNKMTFWDHQDMTAHFCVDGIVSDFLLNLIPRGELIPKPMGVGYTVTNRLPVVSGEINVYVGVALYGACTHSFGPVTMPDLDSVCYLVDELGSYLMDENSVVITDD